MPEQITTVAELEALPVRTILADNGGHPVWRDHVRGWRAANGTEDIDPDLVIRDGAPLTVLYRPDAPSLGADDQAGGPLKGAPKPTAETVADALIRYETSGMCRFGTTCGLCDCGKADETPEQTQTRDAMEMDRARAVLALIPEQRCAPSEDEVAEAIAPDRWREVHDPGCPDGVDPQEWDRVFAESVRQAKYPSLVAARAVAKLYGDQPTVAQAKAEALREVADELDRDAAEGRAARRIADVRCMWCDLRYDERQEYSCQIEGAAHQYDEAELAEAAQPDDKTSWIGNRLRARAATIESGAEHG